MRPIRLNQLIYIQLPDEPARVPIFKAQMRKNSVNAKVDFGFLALYCEGFSGADIAEVCSSAKRITLKRALRSHQGLEMPSEDPDLCTVQREDLEQALKEARVSVSQADLARERIFEE
jgi:transitional endoplasmic reticulum ATPase